MVKKIKTNSSSQLRWVILLLGVAVVLPTVCLLWFMTQAVRNERLAVRQKLVDYYSRQGRAAFMEDMDKAYPFFIKDVENGWQEKLNRDNPYLFFLMFASRSESRSQGMIIYGKDGLPICPIFQSVSQQTDDLFIEPFKLELEGNYKKAIEEYSKLAEKADSDQIRYQALLAKARCLDKAVQPSDAINILKKLSNPKEVTPELVEVIQRCRVFLAELYFKTKSDQLQEHLFINLYKDDFAASAETSIWQLEKMIYLTGQAGLSVKLSKDIKLAKARIRANKNALKAYELFKTVESLSDWPERTIRRLSADSDLYGMHYRFGDLTFLRVFTEEGALKFVKTAAGNFKDDTIEVIIQDNYGRVIGADENGKGEVIGAVGLGRYLPDFRAVIYFRDDSVLQIAADKQTSIYRWAGVLVIVLILLSGAAAGQVIGRQIKLNKLKNDFIATVTHELKTPLASMRVLVDTLLEGRYADQKQVTEYLELVSKENKRLTGLIDNFLSFSRMERNKQVFDMDRVTPAEIAKIAAEAVGTKFSKYAKGNCDFTVNIDDELPQISADKDAMVTVLVNLLDNAFKYSGDDKRIDLNVSCKGDQVCFQVRDNGIGLSRKAQKKIFKKFYQADSSLARTAEGCGLGLSIVKFIVDAHKGSITVNSKPELGTVFNVCLKGLC